MKMAFFLRCLFISAIIAAIGSFLTMTIAIPSDEDVLDVSGITKEELAGATPDELEAILEEKAVYRRVSGLERFSFVVAHPQFWWFYFQAAVSIFCLILPATLLASLWNIRATRQKTASKTGT
jgi:4-amino-4-deoxy-L-arabinose transferase-like glycosyltransferase